MYNFSFIMFNLLSQVIVVFFFHYYLQPKYRYSNIAAYLVLTAMATFSWLVVYEQMAVKNIISIVCFWTMDFILYKGSIKEKIFAPLLILMTVLASESIIFFLAMKITGINDIATCLEKYYYIIYILEACLILMFIELILKISKPNNLILKYRFFYSTLIFTLVPYTFALSLLLAAIVTGFSDNVWILVLFLLMITFVVDFFMIKQAQEYKKMIKAELIDARVNLYYQELLQEYLEMKEDMSNYQVIRHDLINYIERIKVENNSD